MGVKFVPRTSAPKLTALTKDYFDARNNPWGISPAAKIACRDSRIYAWCRFYELHNQKPVGFPDKNVPAKDWYKKVSDKYKRGSTPKLGAILCLSGGKDGAGKVAIVEQLLYDKSLQLIGIKTSEANSSTNFDIVQRGKSLQYVSLSESVTKYPYKFIGFIYPTVNFDDPILVFTDTGQAIQRATTTASSAVGSTVSNAVSQSASAQTSSGPKFVPRLSKPDYSNKYYQAKNNPWGYSPLDSGNCTTYAWCRFHEILGSLSDAPGCHLSTSHAEYWFDGTTGYKTGKTPKLGAILCLRDGNFSGLGHVAVVEEIKENGDIVTSEGGYNAYTFEVKTRPKSQNYVPYGGYGFQGFIYSPIDFSGTGLPTEGETEEEAGIDWQKRASKLISSDNYTFITVEEEEKKETPNSTASLFKSSLENLQKQTYQSVITNVSNSLLSIISDTFAQAVSKVVQSVPRTVHKKQAFLSLGDNTVEAPFIELEIDGYKIGSYGGTLDNYPNYVTELQVSKQNGVINQYTIHLTHQVRYGDDPNLLDELLSRVNYDKISIKYGDCNTGTYFQDTEAIITNVSMSRSYTNMNISYTVEATSAGELVKTYTTTFPAVTDRPSNVIRNLVYGTSRISQAIQSAFPGMRNKTFVDSNNLLPNNDAVVSLDAQHNVNAIDYLNYLVANMSNQVVDGVIRQSTYYMTFIDNDPNNEDGAYFKVTEVSSDLDPYAITDKVYSITVGYNDDIVYNFSVDSTDAWELLYNNSEKSTEYFYSISNSGDVEKTFSPTLVSSVNAMSEIGKNWWTQMVKFPITASLTIKGLLKPIMLMDYINIDVLFYGVPHITSGVYAIVGQTDRLSGIGYTTTLSLIRVGSNV